MYLEVREACDWILTRPHIKLYKVEKWAVFSASSSASVRGLLEPPPRFALTLSEIIHVKLLAHCLGQTQSFPILF